MLKQIISLTILLFASHSFAGITIDNGYPAKDGIFPNLVKIGTYEVGLLGLEYISNTCTGTLIGETTLVTSAHCLDLNQLTEQGLNLISRVSQPGKQDADPDRSILNAAQGGVKIATSYINPQYIKEDNIVSQIKNKFIKKYTAEGHSFATAHSFAETELDPYKLKLVPYEISFATLAKPIRTLRPHEFGTLNCKKKLNFDSPVMIVGYGAKINHNGQNTNKNFNLHYGYNYLSKKHTDKSQYVLLYDENNPSLQLSNQGDSGSPLFEVNNAKTIFGTFSMLGGYSNASSSNKVAISNRYSSTSSPESLEYYKYLLNDKNISQELKKILERCLQESKS